MQERRCIAIDKASERSPYSHSRKTGLFRHTIKSQEKRWKGRGTAYLGIPGAEWLDGTAQHDDFSGQIALWGWAREAAGSCPPLLHVVQAHVEADRLRQKWQQSSLLQLVVYDGRVASTPASRGATQLFVSALPI